jgi:hypothetical protein
MRGISEVEIHGVKRGFKFGTYALSITCDLEKCTLSEIGDKLKKASLSTALHLLYGAAVSYCKTNKSTVDFEVTDIGDWMDEIGLAEGLRIIGEGLSTTKIEAPKKASAPEEG